ncbi:MAG: PilX N-terminal domain-containing pilus assembly protein [Gammaproteobacteria bacterium]
MMRQPVILQSPGRRQNGVVLVISLLMLLVLTLIGLAATRSTALEERMTANQNDTEVAFQAAEAALRDGEGQLSAAALPNFTANASGGYDQTTMVSPQGDWRQTNWSSTAQIKKYAGGIIPIPITGKEPSYFIVLTNAKTQVSAGGISPDSQLQTKLVYYIYAHGWGISGDTEVVLQSAYGQ